MLTLRAGPAVARFGRPLVLAVGLLSSSSLAAQDLMIYPSRGQSQALQSKDQYECHLWASQQSGFDPTRPTAAPAPVPPPPQQEAPVGGVFRGAGRGAALGAVGGAIGAATGALIGGIRRREQNARMQQEQQNYQQQVAAAQSQQGSQSAAQRNAYNRGMTACLQGRGYTVS